MQSVSPRWQQSCQEKEVGVADASFPHATNQLPPIVIQDEGEPSIGPQSSAQRHRVHADRTVCSKADEGIVGGINWSSQHNRKECCDGRETAVGSSVTGQVEVARAAR